MTPGSDRGADFPFGWRSEQNLYQIFNPFTAKCGQRQIPTKLPNFIFLNFEKQIASCESTGREVSFEWSLHRISSTHSKVRVTLQNSIKHSGSERVKTSRLISQGFFHLIAGLPGLCPGFPVIGEWWHKEENRKTFVSDKTDRAITCVFCRHLHLTSMFTSLLQKDPL